MSHRPPKLLERLRQAIRLKGYSIRTEEAYVNWCRRFILFHDKRHPRQMGSAEVEAFLSHLASEGNVAPSTQNQALSALLFLYRNVLKVDLDDPIEPLRAEKRQRVPTVLTPGEVQEVLANLSGKQLLMAQSQLEEAGQELSIALEVAQRIGNPTQLWKTHAAFGDLRMAQERPGEAQKSYGEAIEVIQQIAAGLDDQELRETFLNSAAVRSIMAKSEANPL